MSSMIRRIAFALFLIACLPLQARATAYFSSIDDLPIPDGMTELADQSLVFDTPAGRIVTAAAEGATTVAAVRAYYRSALPPLGWAPRPDDDGDSFVREGQTLTIDYAVAGGEVTVRIRLVPTGADGKARGKGAAKGAGE